MTLQEFETAIADIPVEAMVQMFDRSVLLGQIRAKEAEIARAQSARQTAINEHDNTIRGLTAELAALNTRANLNL